MNEKLFEAGTAAEEAGRGQDVSVGQGLVKAFSTAIVQLDCEGHRRRTAQEVTELSDGSTLAGTGVQDGERLVHAAAAGRQ